MAAIRASPNTVVSKIVKIVPDKRQKPSSNGAWIGPANFRISVLQEMCLHPGSLPMD